jgi:hypothetical protein
VTDNLSWFISHVESSYGICVFEVTDWSADEVDVTAYGDTSGIRMGFYFAESKSGFQPMLPHDLPKDVIFFFEALTVLFIIQMVCSHPSIPKQLVVFSDNMNTIDIFSSLCAKPCYNTILKPTVSLLLQHHLDLHVIHIPGEDNVIADSLSCFQNSQALAACPGLSISPFQPP